MYRINNNEFVLLNKYKVFLNDIDNLLENVPRRDYYFKDKIKNISHDILLDIFKLNYQNDNLIEYQTNIKANIAYLDFLLDRLHAKKYIRDKSLYLVGTKLVEINKIVNGWIKSKVANES